MALVLYNIAEPSLEGATPSLLMNLFNHIASLQASNIVMHSTSQIEFGYNFLFEIFLADCSII